MSDSPSLPDRARSMALRDAAQVLRDRDGGAGRDMPREGGARSEQPPRERPGVKGRRSKPRRAGDPAGDAAAEALGLLADAQADLSVARAEIDRLRAELDAANASLLEEAREAALMRRQRDGLQFRTDYLEEKLDAAVKALTRARRPWWRRRGG